MSPAVATNRKTPKPSPTVARFASCQRGDTVNPTPGTQGRFVGITPGGTVWIAFPEHDFDQMARNFDKAFAPARR